MSKTLQQPHDNTPGKTASPECGGRDYGHARVSPAIANPGLAAFWAHRALRFVLHQFHRTPTWQSGAYT